MVRKGGGGGRKQLRRSKQCEGGKVTEFNQDEGSELTIGFGTMEVTDGPADGNFGVVIGAKVRLSLV